MYGNSVTYGRGIPCGISSTWPLASDMPVRFSTLIDDAVISMTIAVSPDSATPEQPAAKDDTTTQKTNNLVRLPWTGCGCHMLTPFQARAPRPAAPGDTLLQSV